MCVGFNIKPSNKVNSGIRNAEKQLRVAITNLFCNLRKGKAGSIEHFYIFNTVVVYTVYIKRDLF